MSQLMSWSRSRSRSRVYPSRKSAGDGEAESGNVISSQSDYKHDDPSASARALRTAMLKRRFMTTILNAQQLLSNNEEKEQHQERVRIEATKDGSELVQREIKREAASERVQRKRMREAASDRVQRERKRVVSSDRAQRERKREAARNSLEKMERSVVIDENLHIIQEFHNLYCSQQATHPLIQFGLILKEDGEEEDMDVEEGEIWCVAASDSSESSRSQLISRCQSQILVCPGRKSAGDGENTGHTKKRDSENLGHGHHKCNKSTSEADSGNLISSQSARALRTAMLKRRFMSTILNAQQKLGSINGATKEEIERVQRKRKREAARNYLEKMERSVVIDENLHIIQEFHKLYCWQQGAHPLMQFGLILKDDGDMEEEEEEEEEEAMDVEEGEIV